MVYAMYIERGGGGGGGLNGPTIKLESTSFLRRVSTMSGSDMLDCKLLQTKVASGRLSRPGSKPCFMPESK